MVGLIDGVEYDVFSEQSIYWCNDCCILFVVSELTLSEFCDRMCDNCIEDGE